MWAFTSSLIEKAARDLNGSMRTRRNVEGRAATVHLASVVEAARRLAKQADALAEVDAVLSHLRSREWVA